MGEDGTRGRASDEQLVLRYCGDRGGDAGRAAAAELVVRWQEPVFAWCLRMLREREAALDAAQESLVRMYEGLDRYEPRGRFSAWLFTIVHHHCLSQLRRRTLARDWSAELDALATPGEDPAGAFESGRARERLLGAMVRVLDERERLAIWLRAYEGMSVDDVTRILGLPGASGARSVLQSARRKLREELGRMERSES